ncbi:MAG TPA: hypothetical protein VEF03_06845 [Candidatus Binataceae bacterium]|nr:hypothetical protein [Candidatus Binataceae bacterium]
MRISIGSLMNRLRRFGFCLHLAVGILYLSPACCGSDIITPEIDPTVGLDDSEPVLEIPQQCAVDSGGAHCDETRIGGTADNAYSTIPTAGEGTGTNDPVGTINVNPPVQTASIPPADSPDDPGDYGNADDYQQQEALAAARVYIAVPVLVPARPLSAPIVLPGPAYGYPIASAPIRYLGPLGFPRRMPGPAGLRALIRAGRW